MIDAKLLLEKSPCNTPIEHIRYTKAEKFIESDYPAIRRSAMKFVSDTPLKTAEAIYRWVAENVVYSGYSSRPRGAIYAFKKKKGDCTEYMYLFAAMCRAAGIPARCAVGYVCKTDGFLQPAGYHNWAEFYNDGAWRIADPHRRVFNKKFTEYVFMRIIESNVNSQDFERYKFDGEGLKVRMNTGR